jgi:hypothetical protein
MILGFIFAVVGIVALWFAAIYYIRARHLMTRHAPTPRPPGVVAFFDLADNDNLSIEGKIKTMQLKEGQRVKVAVALLTARGNLAKYEDGSASFTSSDPSVASVEQNPANPLEATIRGLDGSNNESVLIEFRADGKPGEGVRDIVATLPVTVTQGDAFVADVRTGTVEDDTDFGDPAAGGAEPTPPADPTGTGNEPTGSDTSAGTGDQGGEPNTNDGSEGSETGTGNDAGNEPTPSDPMPTDPNTGIITDPATPPADPGTSPTPTDTPSTDAGNVPTPAPSDSGTTPANPTEPSSPTSTGEPAGSTPGNSPTETGSPDSASPGNTPLPDDPNRADTPDLTPTPDNPFDSESKPGETSPAPTPTDIPPHDKTPDEARPLPVENPGREPGTGGAHTNDPLTDEDVRRGPDTARGGQPGTNPNKGGGF